MQKQELRLQGTLQAALEESSLKPCADTGCRKAAVTPNLLRLYHHGSPVLLVD